MKRIGVRELRQDASEWLRRTAAGERIEVTVRGRPVARLEPIPPSGGLARLTETGQLRPGRERVEATDPLPAATSDPSASQTLEQMRRDER